MIEGIVIVLVGTVLMFAEPAHDLLSTRRQVRGFLIGPLLLKAYRSAPAKPSLDLLMAQADASLEHHHLLHGIAGVQIVYEQAVDPRPLPPRR